MRKLSSLMMIASMSFGVAFSAARPANDRYLAFQIFTASPGSSELDQCFPPLMGSLEAQVDSMVRAMGTLGSKGRKLGFMVGPLAFDDTDSQVQGMMREAFAVALKENVATGFHLDDSMFWGRLKELNRPENLEWLDWNETPNTGRRLDWSSVPIKIMPQLCLNSPAIEERVRQRARLIGEEAMRGIKLLRKYHKEELFMGIIAGWETQIGPDFETGRPSGYHALSNKGFTVNHPPHDMDEARADVVNDFVNLWTSALARTGIPDDKIFSHTAFMSQASFAAKRFSAPDQVTQTYLETIHFTPPSSSLGPHHIPGYSTYPQFGLLEEIQRTVSGQTNKSWASSEGTAVDPGAAENGNEGISMERYLGNLFNRGAVLVNVFGWGVGPPSNPFRKIAENKNAVAAYKKWLKGEVLPSDPPAQLPSRLFFEKLRKLQRELPPFLTKNGPGRVGDDFQALNQDLRAQHYGDAETEVDKILQAIAN